MSRFSFRVLFVIAVAIAMCSAAVAQRRAANTPSVTDKYLISAEAGGVNHTEGSVSIDRVIGKSGMLIKGDKIEIGDRVTTASDSRAEVLLNPGSYVRLGANSAFEFKTTSLDDLQIQVDSGSAMFEVYAANEFTVTVFTPKGQTVIVETGVYRIDVSPDGTAKIAVTQGKAEVGAMLVKKGQTATIGAGAVAIAKFDRGKRDEFAEWSRTRAKDLAKMTSSLKNRTVRDSLISSFNNGIWGMRRSFGLWVFNPFLRAYCFLPFGYDWYSPYGYGYGPGLWWYDLPLIIRYPPVNPTPVGDPPPRTDKEGRRIEAPGDVLPHNRIGGKREPPTVREINPSDFPGNDSKRRDPVFMPPVSVPMPMPAPKIIDVPPPTRKPIDN